MKRINPSTGLPFKRGDVRSDGFIFYGYNKAAVRKSGFFGELWFTKDAIDNRKKYAKKYREDNKDLYEHHRKNNPIRYAKYSKKYKDKNPHYVCATASKRRASKLSRTPSWLTKNQLQQIELFYKEAKKLSKLMGEPYHVDHIVPLCGKKVSGLHVPWNLQVIKASDNLKKSNSHNV